MTTIRSLLEEIRSLPPVLDFDGYEQSVELEPPLQSPERESLRAACGGKIPDDLSEMLDVTAGFRLGALSFRPEPEKTFSAERTFLRASHYGNGDGLAIEPVDATTRVWWVGHDPWFLVLWGASLREFLEQFLERAKSYSEDEDQWQPLKESPALQSNTRAGGKELQAFARSLKRGSIIHDLREAAPGTEIPFQRLSMLMKEGSLRQQDLLLGFEPAEEPPEISWQREKGPPSLALSKTASGGTWSADPDQETVLEVGFSSAGGPGRKGIYVEVSGPAFDGGLVAAERVSFKDGGTTHEGEFTTRGRLARVELPDISIEAAYSANQDGGVKVDVETAAVARTDKVFDPKARKRKEPLKPPPMPVMIARVVLRGVKKGSSLLMVRVGPLDAEPGRGSALQGKQFTTR